ncbi:MAG: DUF1461 domain-containing protein [Coriobacteriales bacterium]|nr:DUF1461 domain-containing protein [Coriobacteriales bacterium]
MKLLKTLAAFLTALALALSVVGLGIFACTLPPVTQVLASNFARDDLSPFNKEQLTHVANATRDFSFGSHDELALYRTIYGVDKELENSAAQTNTVLSQDFPKLQVVSDLDAISQYREAFFGASEVYCYSPEAVSHLNDCYQLAAVGYPGLMVVCALAIAGMATLALPIMREDESYRRLGNTTLVGGAAVLLGLLGLGTWAALDFNGFFTAFHELLFAAQGNWTFPFNSLLICALPEAFWMGMGAVALGMAVLLSIVLIVAGIRLRCRQ